MSKSTPNLPYFQILQPETFYNIVIRDTCVLTYCKRKIQGSRKWFQLLGFWTWLFQSNIFEPASELCDSHCTFQLKGRRRLNNIFLLNIVESLPIPQRIGAFRRVSRGRWTHWWRRWWSPAEMRRGSRILKGLRSLSKKWWKTVKSLGGRTMIRLIWLPQLKRSFASWVQQHHNELVLSSFWRLWFLPTAGGHDKKFFPSWLSSQRFGTHFTLWHTT